MHFGAHQDLELLALLVALGGLLALAPTLRLPLPILLVVGGVVMGFIPGLPHLTLPPEIVLVAVLPPLLYSGAFFTSLRGLRENRRPIALLAFGLVATTMTAVAVVAHEWIGLSWAVAFTLGAIVSPTDALAATEIASRVGAPRRIVSLIEGESLVNDGSALVLYKAAVGAAIGGTFSLVDTSGRIVLNVVGGIAIGLAAGYVVRQVRRRLDDPPVEIAIAVLSGYLAYLLATAAGVSGVLAAVTIGVYMGWYTPELTNERTRLSGDAFWEILVFLVNALLFVLVGLQLHGIIDVALGPLLAEAHRLRGSRVRDRDRHAHRVGADLHVPAALGDPLRPRARPVSALAVAGGASRGSASAARSPSSPHSHCRSTSRTASSSSS